MDKIENMGIICGKYGHKAQNMENMDIKSL
jgi:hypothetical protein